MAGSVIGGSARKGISVGVTFGVLFIGWKRISKKLIKNAELVTEENKKSILSALGWGALGSLLGPVGGVAGLVLGGRTKEICFALYLKDGRRYLITSDTKTYQNVKALCF